LVKAKQYTLKYFLDLSKKNKAIYFRAAKNTHFFLYNQGIIQFLIKVDGTEDWKEVYTWNNFKFTGRYLQNHADKPEYYVNFDLDGLHYYNFSIKDLKKILFEHHLNFGTGKYALNKLIALTFKKVKIKEIEVREVMGFTDKWTLPTDYYFDMLNFRREARENFKAVCTMKIDAEDIVKKYRALFNATTIEHRDLVYAYGEVAPFLYAFRDKIGLLPILGLNGPAQLGKTWLAKIHTVKKWHTFDTVIGPTSIRTTARGDSIFTHGTLPVCIDDAEKLRDDFCGIIKTYTATEDRARKLTADRGIGMNAIYCTPLILTHNVYPEMYADPNFRQRVVILPIRTVSKSEGWLDLYDAIPDGAVGKYVMTQTKDMTFEDIYSKYKSLDLKKDYDENQISVFKGDNRANAILRLFALGKYLAKWLYNIDLNISLLPSFITSSRIAGSEDYYTLIENMIKISNNWNWKPEKAKDYRAHYWVKSEVEDGEFKDEYGYFINTQNRKDLMKFMGLKKLSAEDLAQQLMVKWPKIHKGNHYISGYSIFIPLEYLQSQLPPEIESTENDEEEEENDTLEDEIAGLFTNAD
jgi:hypothetical protein